jgi:DNA polymerase-3 subunit epsilon
MNANVLLNELCVVAFDTETSGAYPVGNDIVEFGAIKWCRGQEVGQMQFLLKPREKMTDFIIGIHGISNEMVSDSPSIGDKINEIHDFLNGAVVLAHHAPFDMGFLAFEFEKANLALPKEPALCTSLLSRKWIHGVENHKLQTLVKHLQIEGGKAHRAYDDAKACLQVALACFSRMGAEANLGDAMQSQGKSLNWKDYSLLALKSSKMIAIKEAILSKRDIDLIYRGGSKKGQVRRLTPLGIVRNPDGDYVQAYCLVEKQAKRYYISRIDDVAIVY